MNFAYLSDVVLGGSLTLLLYVQLRVPDVIYVTATRSTESVDVSL